MIETCIAFSMEKNYFFTPITMIKEIVEIKQFTPFPQKIAFYLGIINLRGILINLICPYCNNSKENHTCCNMKNTLRNKKNRIIIFASGAQSYFGILGQDIHKLNIEISSLDEREIEYSNKDINGYPHSLFLPHKFIEKIQGGKSEY